MHTVIRWVLVSLLLPVLHAQAPVEVSPATLPNPLLSDSGRIFSANVFGSPHDELFVANDGTLDVADFFTGQAPTYTAFTTDGTVTSIAVADFNGDNLPDLAVYDDWSGQDTIKVSLQVSSGTFPATLPAAAACPVHAADLDGDGDIDLVSGGRRWLNAGNGTFAAPINFTVGGSAPLDVAPGDVDGDGDKDMVATFIGNSSAGPGLVSRIHRHNADHSFTLFGGQLLAPNSIAAVTNLADMNGDGKADIVFFSKDAVNSYGLDAHGIAGQWLGNTASTTGFVATAPCELNAPDTMPYALPLVDMDGDGRRDVIISNVVTNDESNPITVQTVYMTTPSGALQPTPGRGFASAHADLFDGPCGVAPIDFDQDGRPDFVLCDSNQTMRAFHNDAATATAVTYRLHDSNGSNYLWRFAGIEILAFTLESATNGEALFGTPITLTFTPPGGPTEVRTHTMSRGSAFYLPLGLSAQPLSITVSAPGGWSQQMTVHPMATLSVTSGDNQSALLGQPFGSPIAVSLLDGDGQPISGIAVHYPSGGVSTATPSFDYTDANGLVRFYPVSGPNPGTETAPVFAMGYEYESFFTLTSIGDTLQIDTPTAMTSCIGQTITISGHIFDGSGAPRAGASIQMTQTAMSFPATATTSAADGSFSFTGTTPVAEVATFAVSSQNTAQAPINGTVVVSPITVTFDSGANQLLCASIALVPIVGHISSACGDPVAGRTLTIGISAGTLPITFATGSVITDSTGSFSIQPQLNSAPPTSGFAVISFSTPGSPTPGSTTITYTAGAISAASGDLQVVNAGETFAQPIVISMSAACGFTPGTIVTFSTTTPGVSVAPTTTTIDAQGNAQATVSTTGSANGAIIVHASAGPSFVDFHLFARRFRTNSAPFVVSFTYAHEHANVPLVLAADSPATPTFSTPWGTIYTSIISPGPSFGVLDGLGIFGPMAPNMMTLANGLWTRTFILPAPIGLTFVAQMYGYDVNAAYPYDYIVSNPATFTF